MDITNTLKGFAMVSAERQKWKTSLNVKTYIAKWQLGGIMVTTKTSHIV